MKKIVTERSDYTAQELELLQSSLSNLVDRVGATLYVIMNKSETTVLIDPGLSKPWCTSNEKIAHSMTAGLQKQGFVGAHAVTLSYAIKRLVKQNILK